MKCSTSGVTSSRRSAGYHCWYSAQLLAATLESLLSLAQQIDCSLYSLWRRCSLISVEPCFCIYLFEGRQRQVDREDGEALPALQFSLYASASAGCRAASASSSHSTRRCLLADEVGGGRPSNCRSPFHSLTRRWQFTRSRKSSGFPHHNVLPLLLRDSVIVKHVAVTHLLEQRD